MNASLRWSEVFKSEVGCAKCRRTDDLTLYTFNGKPVPVEELTLDQLNWQIDRMDAWCSQHPVKINTRVAGPGRKTRKEEAALIANARIAPMSAFDRFVVANTTLTKQELFDKVKQRPCMSCGETYPAPVLEFYHKIGSKLRSVGLIARIPYYTIYELITEIEKCCLLCANCTRLISSGLKPEPNETIVLDGNFFASFHKS